MFALKTHVINKLCLHEYFQINVAENVKKLDIYMKDPMNINPKSALNRRIRDLIKEKLSINVTEVDLLLKSMTNFGVSRYGVTTDIAFVACLLIDEDL
jgi:hypothetical protein